MKTSGKYLFSILALIVTMFLSSCHAPTFEASQLYEVNIYSNSFRLIRGNEYTFYSVITPGSECEVKGNYSWATGQYLTIISYGDTSVENVRNAMGSSVTIPDDSYCQYCTVRVGTPHMRQLASKIIYKTSSTKLPSATMSLVVVY